MDSNDLGALSGSRQTEAQRNWYLRNRTEILRQSQVRNAVRRKRVREFLDAYKATHPCVDCGESDPVVLDFDHVGTKSFNISAAYQHARGIDSIKAEITQCEIRCANCHRRKTHGARA